MRIMMNDVHKIMLHSSETKRIEEETGHKEKGHECHMRRGGESMTAVGGMLGVVRGWWRLLSSCSVSS